MKYIKQLDSIRAIAVILVIMEHWIPDESRLRLFVSGAMGVDIFFVLSGFLITSILIDNKIKAESGIIHKGAIFKTFYVRRTLRIFPIYYLTIFFLLIFHESSGTNIKANFGYFLTYTSNVYFHKIQAWDGIISHLWSLAVEEQFYIFWPFIILFVPGKYLLHVIVIFISVGLISQHFWAKNIFDNILVINCFDSFGLGALLSWVIIFRREKLDNFYKAASVAGIISAMVLVLQLFIAFYTPFSKRTLHSLIALSIITYILDKTQKQQLRFRFILNNKVLIFLGRISYGIYLYHLILPTYLEKYLVPLNSHITVPGTKLSLYLYYAENFLLLVLFSWLSWKLIEQPILSLKKHMRYEVANS